MALKVAEIFRSIQGESYLAGLPCSFVRLTGCNLRCSYCDTSWAWKEGKNMSINGIMDDVAKLNCTLVEITGGEPLLQNEVVKLVKRLHLAGFVVMIETNGSLPIYKLPKEIIKIVDIKTPGSGMMSHNLLKNVQKLTANDEIKFVVTDLEDFEWSIQLIQEKKLYCKTKVAIAPANKNKKFVSRITDKIIESGLPIRLNMQLHKIIWPGVKKGR